MKIYDKNSFLVGFVFLCLLLLFAVGAIHANWWQWLFSIALSARFLYVGLSKNGSTRQAYLEKNYKRVSQELFGRYAGIKTSLPLIILVGFFVPAIIIRYTSDRMIPVEVIVVVLLCATAALFYSIGLNRQIAAHIDTERSKTKTMD